MVLLNTWTDFKGCEFRTIDEDLKNLIKKGEVDLNDTNKLGQTFLIISIYQDNMDMIRFLLNNGADPNKKINSNKNGYDLVVTDLPITIAFKFRKIDILNLLIEFDANPNIEDRFGKSFKQYFEEFKKDRITDDQVKNIDNYIYQGLNIKRPFK